MAEQKKGPGKPTEKQIIVLSFLQSNEGAYFGDEIAEASDELNPKGIHGVMNGLYKRGLVGKDKTPRTVTRTNRDGEPVEKETEATAYSLTDEGRAKDLN
jgi:hypothetical protein